MDEDDFLTANEALVRSEDHFQSALETKKSMSKSTQDVDIAGKPEKQNELADNYSQERSNTDHRINGTVKTRTSGNGE